VYDLIPGKLHTYHLSEIFIFKSWTWPKTRLYIFVEMEKSIFRQDKIIFGRWAINKVEKGVLLLLLATVCMNCKLFMNNPHFA